MENLLDTIGTPKRKRGAPFGNQNARKHGLYSKHLPPELLQRFNGVPLIMDFAPEIAAARVRLSALLNDPEVPTDHIIKTVKVLTKLMSIQRRYAHG